MKRVYVKRNVWFWIKRALLLCFVTPLLFVVLKVCCRWSVKGQHNLKLLKKQGCIIVMNHCHALDGIMTAFSVAPERLVRITTIAANCELKFAGKVLRSFGCIPFPLDMRGLKRMMDEVVDEAKRGGAIVFMPEGHLIKDCGELREFKKGAFAVAKRAGVPIVPIAYSYKLTRSGKLKYTANICAPIASDNLTVEELRDKAFAVMSDYTWNNKNIVERKYGQGVYSGDPNGERIFELMKSMSVDRNHLKIGA